MVAPATCISTPAACTCTNLTGFAIPTNTTGFSLDVCTGSRVGVARATGMLSNVMFAFCGTSNGARTAGVRSVTGTGLATAISLRAVGGSGICRNVIGFFSTRNAFLSRDAVSMRGMLPAALPRKFSVGAGRLSTRNICGYCLVPGS